VDNGWGSFWLVSVPYIEKEPAPTYLSGTDVLANGQTVAEALNQLLTIKNTTGAILGLSV